jgi:hypothetical protein
MAFTRPLMLLLASALTPAAIASPIPANLRQPLTLEKDSGPVITAQAEPQSDQAIPPPSREPSEEEATAELAKAAQNPIANLISLPFQNNTIFGVGPQGERTLNVLNIQPVIPVPLSKDLLLITRTIVPVINQPTSPTGRESLFGLGDINPQFYFTPLTKSRITWGVGPSFVLPTATQEALGQGKWSAGPAAAVVVTTKRMVFGAVGNNVWSFAGSSEREKVNQMLVQPFLSYNLSHGWYLVSSPIITANWEAPDGDEQWTVPIGGGFGRVFAIGEQKVNASVQAFWNVVRPDHAGDWSLRAQFQFLFPR